MSDPFIDTPPLPKNTKPVAARRWRKRPAWRAKAEQFLRWLLRKVQ